MGVRLPAEYQEVEYVQATGTQAFFTDVPIQDGLTVDSVQTFARGDNYLFGGNNGNVQICFNGTYNGRLQSSYNGFYYWTGGFDVQDNNITKYHVVQTQRNGSQIGFLDDVQILNYTRSTTKDTSAGKTAALFGQRNASDVLSTFYKGKVYSCKVSKDGTLLADFVPCYRKADGEIGMYDLVLQKFYVNEGTGVFLKGNDVIDSISPLMVAWRRIMMAAASVAKKLVKLIATSTSGLVSFDTNVEMPTKVTCEFSPMQEGTGDPSPDNVRPISGWTGCEIRHFYQLFDENSETIERKYYTNTGAIKDDDGVITTRIYTQYIPVSPNTMYTIHGDSNDLAYIRVVEFNSIKTFATRSLSSHIQNPSITIRTQSQTRYLRINPDIAVSNICVYETNAATTTTFPIAFTDPSTGDPLTVYGGTVTLNEDGSADLVVNKAKITYVGNASESWSKFGSGSASAFAMKHPLSNFINTDGAIVADYLVTIGKDASWGSYDNWVSWANPNVLVTGIKSITTVAAWKAYLAENPLTILYNLKSSLSYHFDNVGQLQSFLGTNNIWHNMNGSITAEYYKKQ